MNAKKLSKQEIQGKINESFSKTPSPQEIKKLKKLAMSKNLKLGDYKKKFCKNCCSLFNLNNTEIRIKKGFKVIRCKNCRHISRHKLR